MIVRALKLAYGGACYLVFLAAFLYAIGFVGDLVVPKAIDSGASRALWPALAIDAVLLGVFALQHSVMARPAFKRWWTRFVSVDVERSTYVLLSSLALGLIFWQWRAVGDVVWRLGGAAAAAVTVLFWIGWLIVLASTFMLSHFELFGLAQVWAALRRASTPAPVMRTPFLYGFVRHPIMLGFVIAFWSAPTMSVGRLFFALTTTAYILIALQLEERDLVVMFGDGYRAYRAHTPMLVPFSKWQVRSGGRGPLPAVDER